MDFNKYCKICGHHIEFQYGEELGYCPICDKKITRMDVIAGYRLNARINQLKAMHALMQEANDEEIYDAWIYTMPDEPSEEDFRSIAMNDKTYHECFDKFERLIGEEGNRW